MARPSRPRRRGLAREPWRIHFFEEMSGMVPAQDFFDDVCPAPVTTRMLAVLTAVAEAPPPAFSGGGLWEAMHGDLVGLHEVRIRHGQQNYRLFCLLDSGAGLGGPSIVCLSGLTKPLRSGAAKA